MTEISNSDAFGDPAVRVSETLLITKRRTILIIR